MPPRKVTAPLNYSTRIDEDVSAAECTRILRKHGAKAVALMFDDDSVTGLTFKITTATGDRSYHLPVRAEGMQRQLQAAHAAGLLLATKHNAATYTSIGHARRVAWRQLKDWLEAQLALVEVGMWELSEVMLPWELVDGETTMYQHLEGERKALTTGR